MAIEPQGIAAQTLTNGANSLATEAVGTGFMASTEAVVAYRPHAETAALWVSLARHAGLRLPQKATHLTTAGMEAWLRKLRIRPAAFLRWGGYKTLSDFIRLNPAWTLRSFVGLVLEHRDQMR